MKTWPFILTVLIALSGSRGAAQTATSSLPKPCQQGLADSFKAYSDTKSLNAVKQFVNFDEPNAAVCLQDLAKNQPQIQNRVTNQSKSAIANINQLQLNIAPARASLLTALTNYSPQAQQGATTSSTSATSPVSRLLGFTSIAEEFAGVNISNSSDSLTFSISMESLGQELLKSDVLLPCGQLVKDHCINKKLYEFLRGLTPSFSASSSSAVTGTANSTASPTPVTLSTPGSGWPSFGGFALKGVAWYRTTPVSPSTGLDDLLNSELKEAWGVDSCKSYNAAVLNLADTMADAAASGLQAYEQSFADGYADVLNHFEACLEGDKARVQAFQAFVAEQAISEVIDEDASKTPALGFEYDLNTPLNQPSYSTMKGNFSWGLFASPAKKKAQTVAPNGTAKAPSSNSAAKTNQTDEKKTWLEELYNSIVNPCPIASATPAQTGIPGNTAATVPGASTSNAPAEGAPTAAGGAAFSSSTAPAGNASAPGQATNASSGCKTSVPGSDTKAVAGTYTPPLTLNIMLDGEFYNFQPPSSVPGSRRFRDFQAGAEIDYILRCSQSTHALFKFIGDSTLSGSYLYQDQLSPSILSAPPSGINFSNLPANASTVYTSKGVINLGQVRWALGTGSNLNFPIGFTYSNRSDLINHPIKGLQFGLSYNLSSLFTSNAGGGASGGSAKAN
jgi:hypothetical protein